MVDRGMFETLLHADWSTAPTKRWAALAKRDNSRWQVEALFQVERPADLLDMLFEKTRHGAVLAGFDFPIGVPAAYGILTGAADFGSVLLELGSGRWSRFYEVTETPAEISLERPFYPRRPSSTRHAHLITAHGVDSFNDLRRRCERATPQRPAACPLFWTLGGNQVGKAAIAGWQEIVAPARRRGARLWPFDGALAELAAGGCLVIAETYPAEAYGHVGVRFRSGESKRRQNDRTTKADAIMDWAQQFGVSLRPDMASAIKDGFGGSATGEDRFDAALGLFGMIEVTTGRRTNKVPEESDVRKWEGWILGQSV
jgi:hypothetical protein